ncbi:hypothetical protein EC973_005608 [Apophysomyces ossiformis]|uniref:Uncharacterized protein n=1 Tax=Apophysomyces ossiformis TaxID=679940 RepID=A0A8H7EUS2_9FUNG|nr:hypothetical protein EC973_005608 [Apophysomyces ossiformis]
MGIVDDSTHRVLDLYMHPKFQAWVESKQTSLRSQAPFLKDRRIRIICGQKMNTVIASQYDNEDLPRTLRIARLAPTQLLMFTLTSKDADFVRREFTDNFATLVTPGLFDIRKRKRHKLWLKIIHVEHTTHNSPEASIHTSTDIDDRMKLQRIDVYVVDMVGDSDPAMFSLYDEHVALALMLHRGDYIGLHDPGIVSNVTESQERQSDIVFEYDNHTVLFVMSEKDAQEAGVARPTDASTLSNGKPPGSPASEFWQQPTKNKSIVERDEEVCKADITLWEETGKYTRLLQPGQYALLTGLTTSATHVGAKGPVWYINGSVICGTELFNVSTMKALLTSSSFRRITPIQRFDDGDQWQTDAMIVRWEFHTREDPATVLLSNTQDNTMEYPLGNSIIADAHTSCLRPINVVYQENHSGVKEQGNSEQEDADEKGRLMCEFCGCAILSSDVVQIFRSRSSSSERFGWQGWIEWELDDGSGATVMAYGSEEAILNIPARRFRSMSHEAQVSFLNSVVGKQFRCSLSTTVVTPWKDNTWTAGGHGNITWTADAAEAGKKCEIQLMNGEAKNANLVAFVTDPKAPIDCAVKQFDIYPLNDFAKGQYWIRIGDSATNNWAYSGVFNFVGNGTANPLKLASTSGVATATSSGGAAAAKATDNKPAASSSNGASSSSASQSAQTTDQPKNAAGQLDAPKMMMALAGGAAAAALALL